MFTSKIMQWLLLLNIAEVKKRGERKIDGSRKKLIIPESEIPECLEHEVKSNIGNIFVNKKVLEEYSVKIYKIDPCFCENTSWQKWKNTSWQKWVRIHVI